jgi:hypothetical protein
MKPDVEIYFNDLGLLHGQYKQDLNDATFRTLKELSNLLEQKLIDLNSLIDHKFKLYSRVNQLFMLIIKYFLLVYTLIKNRFLNFKKDIAIHIKMAQMPKGLVQ